MVSILLFRYGRSLLEGRPAFESPDKDAPTCDELGIEKMYCPCNTWDTFKGEWWFYTEELNVYTEEVYTCALKMKMYILRTNTKIYVQHVLRPNAVL